MCAGSGGSGRRGAQRNEICDNAGLCVEHWRIGGQLAENVFAQRGAIARDKTAQNFLRTIRLGDIVKLDEDIAGVRAPLRRESRLRVLIVSGGVGHQNERRNSLVRKKSMIKTVIAALTTVIVVARPTPSAPPVVRKPL